MNVRAASRRPGEDRALFDCDRLDTHGPALAGVDAVYPVGPELVEDPAAVVGPFLDRAKRAGVTRLVALSSMGVEFPREDPGSGRLKLERQVMASELEWTILRPSGFAKNFSEGFLLPGILEAATVATATGDGAAASVNTSWRKSRPAQISAPYSTQLQIPSLTYRLNRRLAPFAGSTIAA